VYAPKAESYPDILDGDQVITVTLRNGKEITAKANSFTWGEHRDLDHKEIINWMYPADEPALDEPQNLKGNTEVTVTLRNDEVMESKVDDFIWGSIASTPESEIVHYVVGKAEPGEPCKEPKASWSGGKKVDTTKLPSAAELYGKSKPERNKYDRTITNKNGEMIVVDVYDVLQAFKVTCPALQHLLKKALACGLRGHKSRSGDLQDILDSAKRAIELEAVEIRE
jgi:hypothetical protein